MINEVLLKPYIELLRLNNVKAVFSKDRSSITIGYTGKGALATVDDVLDMISNVECTVRITEDKVIFKLHKEKQVIEESLEVLINKVANQVVKVATKTATTLTDVIAQVTTALDIKDK